MLFFPPKTNQGWFISFHCKILNKLNISKVKPTWLWSFTLIYFLVQHICFCFLKLVYLCSWQWFLCTFLCLLVALHQGVLKTGHTVEASKENWCWEVVTAVTTRSRKPVELFCGKISEEFSEASWTELNGGLRRNRKPEWLIGILKTNRGSWLFRWKSGPFRDLEQRPKPFYSDQEVFCAVKLYWEIKRWSNNGSKGGNFMTAWHSHHGMSVDAYFWLWKS